MYLWTLEQASINWESKQTESVKLIKTKRPKYKILHVYLWFYIICYLKILIWNFKSIGSILQAKRNSCFNCTGFHCFLSDFKIFRIYSCTILSTLLGFILHNYCCGLFDNSYYKLILFSFEPPSAKVKLRTVTSIFLKKSFQFLRMEIVCERMSLYIACSKNFDKKLKVKWWNNFGCKRSSYKHFAFGQCLSHPGKMKEVF